MMNVEGMCVCVFCTYTLLYLLLAGQGRGFKDGELWIFLHLLFY
jgi:hypothetical protein